MSIEKNIERMAVALEAIANQIAYSNGATAQAVEIPAPVVTPVVAPAPIPNVPPVASTLSQEPAVVGASVTSTPVNVVAPSAPTTAKATFTDQAGMIQYVTTSYQQLGAEKGNLIQNVLGELGCQMVNQIGPDLYDALYTKIEALKA